MEKITIHVCTKNRPSELAILLQSLRTQKHTAWDIVIHDESETSINNIHYLYMLLNRIRLENHSVNIIRNNLSQGVCFARQNCIDKDYFGNKFIARIDDDVLLDSDYLEKLMTVIDAGYDIASGVTPHIGYPEVIRSITKVEPIINEKIINADGELIKNGDDCGLCYDEEKILPTHEFRSCALFKKEVLDKIRYPDNLSMVGFREEGHLCLKAQIEGFKIGVHTGAKALHFQTPSGGVRDPQYGQKVQNDDKYFKKWVKDNKEKLGFLSKESVEDTKEDTTKEKPITESNDNV